ITVLGAPFARRLFAFDLEVEMRPAAAGALFSQQANLLAHLDRVSRLDVNCLQMAVPIKPIAGIADVDDVVASRDRRVTEARKGDLACGTDGSVCCGDAPGHPLASADIQAIVIVDLSTGRRVTAVNMRRLVAHLRRAGEPALFDGINELSRL